MSATPDLPLKAGCAGINAGEVMQNVIIGLTVSFVALSLGAALGLLSGRGAFAGMISAGLIALITSLFGGTRVQCSGPTAPMSAVSAVVVAAANVQVQLMAIEVSAAQLINLTFLLTGVIMLAMGALRLGRFIRYVPNVVISGFMTGISLLIWRDQVGLLFGCWGKTALTGPLLMNLVLALATLVLIFWLAPVMKKLVGPRARFLPATLLAIIGVSAFADLMRIPVEHVNLGSAVTSLAGFAELVKSQVPVVSLPLLGVALPFALQLAMLGYLDTLLTSLVIDKMAGEKTRQNKELLAQGLANGSIAFVGGIPGAQATIRSVLMIKEGASLRLAGIMVGVFVLIEMVLFQGLINLIPKAVFVGVLIKVGYDVFDFQPLRLYCKQVAEKRAEMFHGFFARHDDQLIFVTNRELLMILGTATVTLFWDLNLAVGGFTVLFYLHNRLNWTNPMRDLMPGVETEAFIKQN